MEMVGAAELYPLSRASPVGEACQGKLDVEGGTVEEFSPKWHPFSYCRGSLVLGRRRSRTVAFLEQPDVWMSRYLTERELRKKCGAEATGNHRPSKNELQAELDIALVRGNIRLRGDQGLRGDEPKIA